MLLDGIGQIASAVSSVVDKFVVDASVKEQLKDALNARLHEEMMTVLKGDIDIAKAQIDVNKEQAKHPSLFIGGARAAAMWVCVIGMFYHFILQPFILLILAIFSINVVVPVVSIEVLMAMLGALLGIGGYRSYEKVKGVATTVLAPKK